MTEAMPFLQKYDITFLRPPTICAKLFLLNFRITRQTVPGAVQVQCSAG